MRTPPAPGQEPRWLLHSLLLLAVVALPLAAHGADEEGFMDPALFEARQLEWLGFATEEPMSPGSVANVLAHLEREARDAGDATDRRGRSPADSQRQRRCDGPLRHGREPDPDERQEEPAHDECMPNSRRNL
jgi:hypothetical protein